MAAQETNQTESSSRRRQRGRPPKAATLEIERRILTAAWDCFVDSGFEGTTMEMVAQAAGVSRITVYQRHANKTSLLKAATEDRIGQWAKISAQRDWMLGETLEERLNHFGRNMLLWSNNEEVAATRHFVIGTSRDAEIAARELDFAIREPMIVLLASEIEAYASSENVAPADPREIAHMYMGMLTELWRAAPDAPLELMSEKVSRVVAILMRGMSEW